MARYGIPTDRTPHRVGTAVYDKQTAGLLEDATRRVYDTHPYYWQAVRNLSFKPEPGLGTFATSKRWVTYYDPAMLREWTTDETAAVIVHELEHLLRRHADREPDGCAHDRWNIAADMEINQRLSGLPAGGMYPSTYNLPDGLTAEVMERIMPADADKPDPKGEGEGEGEGDGQPGDGNGKPGDGKPSKCGSAAGGPAADYESSETDGTGPAGIGEAAANRIRREVAGQVAGSAASDEMRTWAERELGIDKQSWLTALAGAISGSIAAVSAPDGWLWPGRRDMSDMGGAMLPRWTGHQVKCAVIIDTSGSITDYDLEMAAAAGQFIGQVAEVTFYGCNNRVTLYGDTLPEGLRGGGGTDMRVGIDRAIADGHALVVVITDTYSPWHDAPVAADLIIGGGPSAPAGAQGAGMYAVPSWATYLPIINEGE